jgi:choline kinase
LIDANTPIVSPLISIDVGVLKSNIVTTNLETNAAIEAIDKYVLATKNMVIMEPYETEPNMRFTASIFLNGLYTKTNALIDTTTSLDYVSKEFVLANGFYKVYKTAPMRKKEIPYKRVM